MNLAVVRDFRAEGWPSMDLCADQLLAHLPTGVNGTDVAPEFRRLFGRLPGLRGIGFNADRIRNRHVLLAKVVRRAAIVAGFVHVVDHSYAHLVHAVPPVRAGVYCHDLDAFRCVLGPEKDPRPLWFRKLARRTLDGLKRAAVVFHSTDSVREQILYHRLVDPTLLIHAPYGVAAEFTAESQDPVERPVADPFLLHVGSLIPRKRIDVLLDVFAAVRERLPNLRLVQVGGPWSKPHAEQIDRLGIAPAVTQLRGLSRLQLAELYRRAAAVLVTSDAEGFGLPVIEALACGAPVVASDIPVLREVGGAAVDFCPVADIPAWLEAVTRAILRPSPKAARIEQASRYSWAEHGRIIGEAYLRLAAGLPLR